MKEITDFYLTWTESPRLPHRNRHLTQLEELIHAFDHPRKGETKQNAALRMITKHLGGAPDAKARAALASIIKANLHTPTARVNTLDLLKHICLVQGGEAGKRGSVNPPNPWRT